MTKRIDPTIPKNNTAPTNPRIRVVYAYIMAVLFFATSFVTQAQIDPELLLGLHSASTTEMNAISGSITGSMLYNTTDKKIYFYNGTNWTAPSNDNWLLDGNTAVAGASFLGTKNDVAMDIRSNNTSILKFGRRQTLGLVQNYPDYTDQNQYLTYLQGNNGVSALQFQADGASFYKPMFFTNSDGNFRLKGSAAGTDLFEIGSAGTSNNGEVEFIIGDDGAEPFIFKRYDYRDGLLKELFRVQGSTDSQNALPRVGVNTGSLANSTLQVNGSLSTAITTAGSNLSLNESHHTVVINSNISITLPAANGATGRVYVLKNITQQTLTVGSYINELGDITTELTPKTVIWLQSDGTQWQLINRLGGLNGNGGSDPDGTLTTDLTVYTFQDQWNSGFQLQFGNRTNSPIDYRIVVENVPYDTIPNLNLGNHTHEVIDNGNGTYNHIFRSTQALGAYDSTTIRGSRVSPRGIGDSCNCVSFYKL
tara:strand:+ start:2813 stop:4249 length:1437 start_codon:yes stop_codon:yes gene_type:complete